MTAPRDLALEATRARAARDAEASAHVAALEAMPLRELATLAAESSDAPSVQVLAARLNRPMAVIVRMETALGTAPAGGA